MKRIGDWFLTYSGVQFYPMDPRPEDVRIDDIAHALSNICRFGGHVKKFYSVAQHSVIVSDHCKDNMAGLMHDATEAYCGDMVRPLKLQLPEYRECERRIWIAICAAFGLPEDLPTEVKFHDNRTLMTERRDLIIETPHTWSLEKSHPAYEGQIYPWGPEAAEEVFLRTYRAILKEAA